MEITKAKFRLTGAAVLLAVLAVIVYDQFTMHSKSEEYRMVI